MLPWQEEYIRNTRELILLRDAGLRPLTPEEDSRRRAEAFRLTERNSMLLSQFLFPVLDALPSAEPSVLEELTAFGDALCDWRENLDVGVYVTIHEALLSLSRIRKDRNGTIRELYRLGMGVFYLRRMMTIASSDIDQPFRFENEMLFTEAASWFRYFDQLDTEETKGYVIRSLANIALCAKDSKHKIAASARMLRVIQDEQIRALAPSLPWEWFLRGTHQQMSTNRESLSRGNLSQEELAAVMDSCYEVFKPETSSQNPSVRWVWPYYEMEYNCGYVNLETTLVRLEKLITETPWDQYDEAGLYGNIQLAINYCRLMERNPELKKDIGRRIFLQKACQKMEKCILSYPPEKYSDLFIHNVLLICTDYFEMDGGLSYREISGHLLERFFPDDCLRGKRTGEIMACLCEELYREDPRFFDEIPFLTACPEGKKEEVLLSYARECGLYADYGLVLMNICRKPRELFEREYHMTLTHPLIGAELLGKHESTRRLADIAMGHHGWYNGSSKGYPDSYVRTDSPYRQMTDVAALASFMMKEWEGDLSTLLERIYAWEGTRFSPLVTSCLPRENVRNRLETILSGCEENRTVQSRK